MNENLSVFITHEDDFSGLSIEYNTIKKTFLDGTERVEYRSYSNFKGIPKNNKKNGSSSIEQLERYNYINVVRRRKSINELAYQNGCSDLWQYFVTLTFDDELVNSYSHDSVVKCLTKWLNNQKHQNPGMKYILVPELHKSGRIHFHGLFSHVPKWKLSKAINAKTGRSIVKNGSIIYNLDNYQFGYTTVSEIKSMEKVCFYITKYITKDLLNLKNKKNVWHSKNLIKPNVSYHYITDDDINKYLDERDISYLKEIEKDGYYAKFITSHN